MSNRLIIAKDMFYDGILRDVKKSNDRLRPLFEAFTNSLEAIKAKRNAGFACGKICVELHLLSGTTDEDYIFEKLVITDDGVGFDRDNFKRLTMYKDYRKGFSNKGSGRLQFLHFFKGTRFASVVSCGTTFKVRNFSLSKDFTSKNAIIALCAPNPTDALETGTKLTMQGLLVEADQRAYSKLSAQQLKNELLSQYVLEFCSHRDSLPEIKIVQFIDGKLDDTQAIVSKDIPNKDKGADVVLNYSKVSHDGKTVEKIADTETFHLSSFSISSDELDANEIKLTSKNEVIRGTSIDLECLTSKDQVDGKRYLFFLSGDYIDRKDGDTRGVLNIPTRDEFRKGHVDDIFDEREIVLEDITGETNRVILSLHDEIRQKTEEKTHDIESLREMFLLNPETINGLTIIRRFLNGQRNATRYLLIN